MPAAAKLHHFCPLSNTVPTTPVPHINAGQQITPARPVTVLIDNHPAVVVGDICICVPDPAAAPINKVTSGSATVKIDGQPAARMGDPTTHGGQIDQGSSTVMIGG
jgi:uncharacterized Zn-binding protein involved in type VI secretion